MVKDLVSKVREWGVSLVCADQIPSEISQFFFSNIGTLVMFRHSDGNGLRRLQRIRYELSLHCSGVSANPARTAFSST
ncbi:MAG: hypothetical protein V3T83_15365 [Acidobacteriota bacterium]